MSLTSLRKKTSINATCRRSTKRQKFRPAQVTCWSEYDSPTKVTVIEVDSLGARLMLPWNAQRGESIHVSLANEVGIFQTSRALVMWTQKLEIAGRVVAGIAFERELSSGELTLAAA